MKKENFTISTAERKRILGRIFPDGCIRKRVPYERDDEATYLGYTPDGEVIELYFWLGDNIDFYFKRPANRRKYECIDAIVNTALANTNRHKERERFSYDSRIQYFVVYNSLGFTLCFRAKEEQQKLTA